MLFSHRRSKLQLPRFYSKEQSCFLMLNVPPYFAPAVPVVASRCSVAVLQCPAKVGRLFTG